MRQCKTDGPETLPSADRFFDSNQKAYVRFRPHRQQPQDVVGGALCPLWRIF